MNTLRVVILCPLAVERRQASRHARGLVGVRAAVKQTGPGSRSIRRAVEGLAQRSASSQVPDLVVLFGVSGGLREGPLAPPITRVVDADTGRALAPSVALWNSARQARPAALATTARPVCAPDEKRRLAEALDADLADCESRAFAQACEQHSLRWAVVRGVSDGPDDALPATAADWINDAGGTKPLRVLVDVALGRVRLAQVRKLGTGARRGLRAAGASLRDLLAQEEREMRQGLPPADRARSILLFGGMFDPPHRAHVKLALQAMRASRCDAVVFIPASAAPLRDDRACASPRDRFDMLASAIRDATGSPPGADDCPCFVSGVELSRPGVSYTIETVFAIRRRLGSRPSLRLLIGADQAAQFHKWRDSRRLLREAPPVVILRPPYESAAALLEALAPNWPEEALAEWRERILESQVMDISSTALRETLAREGPDGPTARRWLAPSVRSVIAARRLYRSRQGAHSP